MGAGRGSSAPRPRDSLTQPTSSSWEPARWDSCTPYPPWRPWISSCRSKGPQTGIRVCPPALHQLSHRSCSPWHSPVPDTSGTLARCHPPASLCHRRRTTPCQSDRLPTGLGLALVCAKAGVGFGVGVVNAERGVGKRPIAIQGIVGIFGEIEGPAENAALPFVIPHFVDAEPGFERVFATYPGQ